MSDYTEGENVSCFSGSDDPGRPSTPMVASRLRTLWLDILFAGHASDQSAEVRKQILISSCFSLVAMVLLTYFGLEGFSQQRTTLGLIVLGAAGVVALNYTYLRLSGNYRLSALLIVCLMMAIGFFLLCTGGTKNTGPLWFFILPNLIFYILGLRRGLITLALLLIGVTVLLYTPNNPLLTTTYPNHFTHRFIAALFSVSVVACAYEFMREEGRRELLCLTQRLDALSRHDELTGLPNRRHMLEALQAEANRHERTNRPFCLLLADIDRFKLVNDSHGHDLGDAALRLVGRALAANTQKRDTVARWGGEEFLLLLPDTDRTQATNIAKRLRLAIEELPIIHNEISLHLTISIGVAQFAPPLTINDVIKQADSRLYQAKNNGRNRVCATD